MIKNHFKFLIIFTLFMVFGILGVTPATVTAKGIDYQITHYTINADIQADGGVDVTEFLTYDFKDRANGVFRDIDYKNPTNLKYSSTGIDQLKVYEAGITDDTLDEYKVGEAKNGQKGIYTIIKRENGIRLKLYCPVDNEEKRFVVQYHLSAAVVKYLDTADFYWRFIGSEWETDLNDVTIVITVPNESSKLKVFSHGPLSGKNLVIDKATVQYVNQHLDAGDSVSLRVLFPATMIESNNKLIAKNELSSILAQEKKWSEEANLKRKTTILSVFLSIGWLALSIIFYIILYRKFGRREKLYFDASKEPPAGYGPAFTEYITKYNTIGPNGITAELMNLVKKKYVHIEDSKELIPINKKKANLTITLDRINNKYEYQHEAYLIDWFFNKIGNGKTVSMNEIQTYSKEHSTEFNKSFTELKKIIKKEAEQLNLVSEKTSAYKMPFIFLLFSTGSGIILAYYSQMYGFMVSAILTSLLLLLLSMFIKRPTLELACEREKWHSYKNHLKAITSPSTTSDYTLNYWEQALIYTIIFGYHKNAIKKLQYGFSDIDFLDSSLTYLHSGHGSTSVLDSLSNTVDSSITNFSSTSGFSGGSSAGGSGGGGGGGGAF